VLNKLTGIKYETQEELLNLMYNIFIKVGRIKIYPINEAI